MNGARERELKLDVPRGFSLARMEPRVDGHSLSPVELQRLHTIYYDTADLRLAHWGCNLRFRYGEGWTLKIPVPNETRGLVREEHLFPGDETQIPAGILDLGTAYFRGIAPVPVAELRTLRTRRRLVSDGGCQVASVVEDDVRVVDGTHVVKRFRQIEIELADAAPDSLLDHLGEELRRHGAGKPDPTPKNVQAIGRRSLGPEIETPILDEHSRIGEVVRAAFAGAIEQIVRYDSKLRLNADADVIHDARVAVRRMRSNLRAFLPVLVFERASELRERLRWLQNGLSEARDMDVFLALMCRLGESLPDADRRAIDSVRRPFDDARQAAYQRFSVMLREERYVALLRDLVDVAKNPPLNDCAAQAACEVIPVLIADSWSTLRKRVRRRSDPPADRELHAIRIAAKRVRYLAEAIVPVAGKAARKLAASVEHIQGTLGDEHDAVVACGKLRTVGAADRDHAFVAGELAGVANLAALEARSSWQEPWRKAKGCRRQFKESRNPVSPRRKV